jgi:hypothetical protein
MKKRLIYWLGGLLIAATLTVFLLLWKNHLKFEISLPGAFKPEELVAVARKIGHELPMQPGGAVPVAIDLHQPVRLAIGSLAMSNDEQERGLGDLLLADLAGTEGLTLVDRQSLDAVLLELHLSLSGLVRARDAVRAGKLLKTDWFLLGTESKINGTNAILLVRLVDARSGILRYAQAFPAQETMTHLAADIAAFVQESRKNAALPELKTFLAIGGFADLSLNNRLASFPNQLRSYLTAAYRKSGVTLLEREAADVLFQEVCLDLAGLTEEGGTNAPPPMQSAYWMVDGVFQSLDNSKGEAEVVIDISQIFGPWSQPQSVFRGTPSEPLFEQIKIAIDARLKEAKPWIMPTRLSEARAQIDRGQQLAQLGHGAFDLRESYFLLIRPESYENLDKQERGRRRHNDQQAIRAFETVLLLQPTNQQAKLYLAACYRKREIGRVDEARDIYRQIIDSPKEDREISLARKALIASFEWQEPDEKARWFASAAETAGSPAAQNFYRQQAVPAAIDAAILHRKGTNVTHLAETRLIEAIRGDREGDRDGRWVHSMDDFMDAFGANTNAAAERLAALLPQMEMMVSNLSPHIVATVLRYQPDTNTPVLAEFRKVMDRCIEHPEGVTEIDRFWESARHYSAFDWLCEHKLYSDAVRFMEGFQIARKRPKRYPLNYTYEDKIALAFAYEGAERWKDALDIFDSFSNRPLKMHHEEPWTCACTPMQTGKEANECRAKLGLAAVHDPREFDVGGNCIPTKPFSAFATDSDGVWLGSGNRLTHLDWNLATNFSALLPKDARTPICALCPSPTHVWIATDGDGLMEIDKKNRRCRRFVVEDGLMMNALSCLSLAGDRLWIGYGHKENFEGYDHGFSAGGGIGCLDFRSNQFISYPPALAEGSEAHENLHGNLVRESSANPTRRIIRAIAADANGMVWFVDEEYAVRRFKSGQNLWDATPIMGRCLAIEGSRLFVGQLPPQDPRRPVDPIGLGVSILNFQTGQWTSLNSDEGLSAETINGLAVAGNHLWVSGFGYIALLDIQRDQILKFAYIPAFGANVQVGGGRLWALYNCNLHCVSLTEVP